MAEHGQLAQADQVMAEFRDILATIVRHCREHFDVCDNPGCPGSSAFAGIAEVIAQGPNVSLAALTLAVHYLAKNEDLLMDELEVALSGTGGTSEVLGDQDGPGGTES